MRHLISSSDASSRATLALSAATSERSATSRSPVNRVVEMGVRVEEVAVHRSAEVCEREAGDEGGVLGVRRDCRSGMVDGSYFRGRSLDLVHVDRRWKTYLDLGW